MINSADSIDGLWMYPMSVFRKSTRSEIGCVNPRDFITLESFGGDGEHPAPIDTDDVVVHLDTTGRRVFCFDSAALLQYAMTVSETGKEVLHPVTRAVISPSFIGWLTLFVQSKGTTWQRYVKNVVSSVFDQRGEKTVMSAITFMQQVYHVVLASCSTCAVHAVNNYVGLFDAFNSDDDNHQSTASHAMIFTYALPIAVIVAAYSDSDGTTLARELESFSKKLDRPAVVARLDLGPMYDWIEIHDQ